MFDFLTDSVENGLNVLDDLTSGEAPSKREVSKLIADGLSIAAASQMTGWTTDMIEKLIEDNG